MDTTDPDIRFDAKGICNHCRFYFDSMQKFPYKSSGEKKKQFDTLIEKIKSSTKNDEYNCVIGLSGGVDSSYLAYIVKKTGLKPLAVHIDNGWNSEFAVKNIENIVKKLNIDLYTHVILWEEFRDLQVAFLKAGVIDLEMVSDNAIIAGVYQVAMKKKIKNFLIGYNFSTESILPPAWYHPYKMDGLNIRNIYKKFGSGRELKTYPIFNLYGYLRFSNKADVKFISLLDYMDYRKDDAKRILREELGWKDHGNKHCESIITRFYQCYILPRKADIDKRKAHLSSLICSGQIARDEALNLIKKDPYEPDQLKEDKEYFLKKLGLSEEEFEEYMNKPMVPHSNYGSYEVWNRGLNKVNILLRRILKFRLGHQIDLFRKKLGFIDYKKIVIETSSICNVRCVWCWMYYSEKKDMGLMSFENFKKLIDLNAPYLKEKKIEITPYHRGEALIHPQFFEMLDYADKKGIILDGIHTNLSLELDIDKLMMSPLPWVLVNIGGITREIHEKVMKGSDFNLVIHNLREMLSKNKFNKRISIKINPTKDNLHQLKDLPYFFEKLGGNPKDVIVSTTGFNLPGEASKEEISEFFSNVVTKEMEKYLRFTYDSDKNIFAKERGCMFMIPTVKWNGKVTICCHDQLSKLDLGNAFETTLKDILKSRQYRIAEKTGKNKKLFFCKGCN